MDGGLLAGDGANLLWHQFVGVVAIAAFVLACAFALFLGIKATIGLRVSEEEEMEGLDILEHGAPGYGELATPVNT
jgi:Amt family ammonium transporter